MADVPVEIFEIITSYLTRADVQSLRLVCREYEAKVSGQFFRNVVIPFRSEIYSKISLDDNGSLTHSASNFLSDGMRIFESFGPHILRFALSLELDESSLAYPPLKPIQEAVPAFWGIYRWPHQNYNRYTDLEGLEQTADEIEGMKKALRCLTKVRNLGLCCDAGLGYLLGPSNTAAAVQARHPVFATSDDGHHIWRSEVDCCPATTADELHNAAWGQTIDAHPHPEPPPHPIAFRKKILEKMVIDAGYRGPQIEEAINVILDTEGTNLANIDVDERSVTLDPSANGGPSTLRETDNWPLIPSKLTRAQKEMLLELEWAHRAMIQSYIIGLVDNAANGCFNDLSTLTIAKLPACNVHLFNRDDLWGAFPNLKSVSLGVIADWRRVIAPSPGCVEDITLSPVQSVGKVFTLLNSYVGKHSNIESIHFEWICGGEFAPSCYQRNINILPAPFLHQPRAMVSPTVVRDDASVLLSLPHVKHLSLKNCWSSPHIFLQMVRQLALSSLEHLELESFSLSGPPTLNEQAPLLEPVIDPAPFAAPMHQMHSMASDHFGLPVAQDDWQGQPAVSPLPAMLPSPAPSLNPIGGPCALYQPNILTWGGIINHFSPSVKIQRLLAGWHGDGSSSRTSAVPKDLEGVRTYIPRVNELCWDEAMYRIKRLSFRSCGYVSVDTPFLNTRALLPGGQQGFSLNCHNHSLDLSNLMQECKDKLLARITPFIDPNERLLLYNAFGLTHAWSGVYDESVRNCARADGVARPGYGRFQWHS